MTHITYLASQKCWYYIAVLLDCHSQMVIGWDFKNYRKKELCIEALHDALCRRKITRSLIHHSDRGSQYTSIAYQKILKDNHIVPSMSRKANVQKSVFSLTPGCSH